MLTVDRNTDAKEFATLQAQFALTGHQLHRTDPTLGKVTYYASRWGMVRWLPSLGAAQEFLRHLQRTA